MVQRPSACPGRSWPAARCATPRQRSSPSRSATSRHRAAADLASSARPSIARTCTRQAHQSTRSSSRPAVEVPEVAASVEHVQGRLELPAHVVHAGDPGRETRLPPLVVGAGHERRERAAGPGRVTGHPERVGVGAEQQLRLVLEPLPDDLLDEPGNGTGITAAEHVLALFTDEPGHRRAVTGDGVGPRGRQPGALGLVRARDARGDTCRGGGPPALPAQEQCHGRHQDELGRAPTRRRGTSTPRAPQSLDEVGHGLPSSRRRRRRTDACVSGPDPSIPATRGARLPRRRAGSSRTLARIQSAAGAPGAVSAAARSTWASRPSASPAKRTSVGHPAVSSATRSAASGSVTPASSASSRAISYGVRARSAASRSLTCPDRLPRTAALIGDREAMATPTSCLSARSPTRRAWSSAADPVEVIDPDPRHPLGQPVRDQGERRAHDASDPGAAASSSADLPYPAAAVISRGVGVVWGEPSRSAGATPGPPDTCHLLASS